MGEATLLDPVFRALADPTRREILGMLRGGEVSTGAIAERFPLSRPTISKHLGVLLEARLVDRRKEGRHQFWVLEAGPLAGAHEWLSGYRQYWRRSLASLKRHVEGTP